MTPVPKSIPKNRVRAWRRLIIAGKNPVQATAIVRKGVGTRRNP